jgi:putative ABC transport system permease protein
MSAVVVFSLAVPIGAAATVFSLARAVVLRALPYREPQTLFWMWSELPSGQLDPFSIPDFLDYERASADFAELGVFASWGANLTGRGEAERLRAVSVSSSIFELLGVEAALGRVFQKGEGDAGGGRVVVLTHGLWQRRFGGDPRIVGERILLNGEAYVVVGVLPPDFLFPTPNVEIASPFPIDADPRRTNRTASFLRVLARLRPGADPAEASRELTATALRLKQEYPQSNGSRTGVRLAPLDEAIVGPHRLMLTLLVGSVCAVLVLTCANLTHLVLVWQLARRKELAIRIALGASREHLVAQVLLESVLLAFTGGALGAASATWAVRALVAIGPSAMPRASSAGVDGAVIAFGVLASLFAGLLVGLFPALVATRVRIHQGLKEGSSGRDPIRLRGLLLSSEVALTLAILAAAGLLHRSFAALEEVDPGFRVERVLTGRLSLPAKKYTDRAAVVSLYEKLSDQLAASPEVLDVGAISVLPLSDWRASVEITVVGRPTPRAEDVPSVNYRMVSPGYFRTVALPVIRGRALSEEDDERAGSVALVSRSLARMLWGEASPVGERVRADDGEPTPREMEIVGVVGDVKQYGLEEEPPPILYVPIRQAPEAAVAWLRNNMFWVAHGRGEPLALERFFRESLRELDPDIAASEVSSMEQVVSGSLAPRRFGLLLLRLFAGASLLLAAAGTYAVSARAAGARRRELAIRTALGARPGELSRMMILSALRQTLAGVIVGLAGAAVVARVIRGMLFGVSAFDPVTFGCVLLTLAAVVLGASYLPARRAASTAPSAAIRVE